MSLLALAKQLTAKNSTNEINEINEKSIMTVQTCFTKATDPYRQAGGKNYWKLHVPADQRPRWVKEIYGLI